MKTEKKINRASPPEALRPFLHHDVALDDMTRVAGYMPLELVLCAAYDQASGGKGKDRHAMGDDFNDQPILTIGRFLKSPDGEAYQAIKKCREGLMMHRRGESDACIKELLGAINYLASVAILVAEEQVARRASEFGVEDEAEKDETAAPVYDDSVLVKNYPEIKCPAPGEEASRDQVFAALCRQGYNPKRANDISNEAVLEKGFGFTKDSNHYAAVRVAKEAIEKWRAVEFGSDYGEKKKLGLIGMRNPRINPED